MSKNKAVKSASKQVRSTLKYMVLKDDGNISHALFKEKKVDFFIVPHSKCLYEGTYLYFISKSTVTAVSNLLKWKDIFACGAKAHFCIQIKSTLNEALLKLAENADLQEIKDKKA